MFLPDASSNPVYYPHVVVDVDERVRIDFLQPGRSKAEDCQTAAVVIADSVRARCPDCRVATPNCSSKLGPDFERWLSEEPVAIPTARLLDGVAVYRATDTKIALAACREADRLIGGGQSFGATCYPPNTARPRPSSPGSPLADIWKPVFGLLIFLMLSGFASATADYVIVRRNFMRTHRMAGTQGNFPALHEVLSGFVAIDPGSVEGRESALELRNRVLKRFFDVLVTVPLLLVLTPVLLFVALCVLVTEGRQIFYLSTRYIGMNRPIRVLKFRTMVRDATSPRHKLDERFMRDGYLDIPVSCEVYTPIGRILERLQIVEIPQLINVLVDGLSLVGNRALPKKNIELLAQFPSWERRFDSPAGITGISQIVGKLNLMPAQRLRLESLYSKVYLEGSIMKCDLIIIWHTVAGVLLRNKGITLDRAEALLRSCLSGK